MGKILVSLLMCCFLSLDVFSQAPAAPAAAPAEVPAKKTVARGRKKAKPAEAATPATPAEPAVAPATPATPATPAASVVKDKKAPKEKTAHAPGNATPGTDKLIGKDAKGHDIYQGPKGGQYYISNGNKQYLDKKDKLKI